MVTKMDTKKLLVSLSLAILAIFMVATVSAADLTSPVMSNSTVSTATSTDVANTVTLEVDGVNVIDNPAVIAGDTVVITVKFAANVSASNVKVKALIEGDKVDVEAISAPFDVEAGHTYTQSLKITVPSELKDQLSDNVDLSVKIWNGDYKSQFDNIVLRVQRPSYNPVVKSVTVSQSVKAGDTFPVDLVLKNAGYDNLTDVYVTVGISELGVQKTAYFGDLANLKECSDKNNCDQDTVSGRLYLDVPYSAKAGDYTLVVQVTNDDVTSTVTKTITVNNDFSSDVIVTSSSQTVSIGESAQYKLLLVNPTNNLKVYKLVSESNAQVSSDVDSVVAVPAGSSQIVTVTAKASEAGKYNFNVNVFSGDTLDSTVALTLNADNKTAANPVVVLTVVLAIIFLVLLVVLIVLLGKKPAKTEEFGESYY